jgi:holo-[acyl-carrier protein] synthase
MGTIRGIGIDAVSIARMDTHRMGAHVISRLFHPKEVQEMQRIAESQRPEYLASRFAVKEAFVKALGTGFRGISPSQIAVVTDVLGNPSIELDQEVVVSNGLDTTIIHVSITHEQNLAIAFVVLEASRGSE